MALQIDPYQPARDIIVHIANSRRRTAEQNRIERIRQNITELSPAIKSTGWVFRFVEQVGESLNVIDDDKFFNDSSYAKELLNFTAAMQLPKEDANPSVITAADVFNSCRISLEMLSSRLLCIAKRIFKMLKLCTKDIETVAKSFQGENAMKTASQILERYPDIDPRRYNRYRWNFRNSALLGTITNWLGDRVCPTCVDIDRMRRAALVRSRFRKIAFSDEEKAFVYEFLLMLTHAFDTIDYLRDVMCCEEIIDTSHIKYVFHDNGFVPGSLQRQGVSDEVNNLSYTVLLPLFFTKELYVHRSKMLATLRSKLARYRDRQKLTLSGDVIQDSRRMRSTDSLDAKEVQEVANIVCISDLLDKNEQHMIRSYGEFPKFGQGDVCSLHSGNIRLLFPSVNAKVDHILKNFGNRLCRTALDKSLSPKNDNIILAEGDVLATHALARQAVVYTNSPVWGEDIIGGVEQPILGGYQTSRHKLLAFLGLFHLLCNDDVEEDQMQRVALDKCCAMDSKLLKELVMEFVERKILAFKTEDRHIKASEVLACANFSSRNAMDAAVVCREMIHYLVADRGRLIPTLEGEEIDGCYFSLLYHKRQHGNAKLLVNVSTPLAGTSTTQGHTYQLYTKDGTVLTSSVDLRLRSAEVVLLSHGGDRQYLHYFPIPVSGDLVVG